MPALRQKVARHVDHQTRVKEEGVDENNIEGFGAGYASAGPSSPAERGMTNVGNSSGSRKRIRYNLRSGGQEVDDTAYIEDDEKDDEEVHDVSGNEVATLAKVAAAERRRIGKHSRKYQCPQCNASLTSGQNLRCTSLHLHMPPLSFSDFFCSPHRKPQGSEAIRV